MPPSATKGTFGDVDIQAAFTDMAFGHERVGAKEVKRFFDAIEEPLSEEECRAMIACAAKYVTQPNEQGGNDQQQHGRRHSLRSLSRDQFLAFIHTATQQQQQQQH